MKNTSFNFYLNTYAYLSYRLRVAREEYENAKKSYRASAKTENQLGKPGQKPIRETLLTKAPRSMILKQKAAVCKTAKNNLKEAQRAFENHRRYMVRVFMENGLNLWYFNSKLIP